MEKLNLTKKFKTYYSAKPKPELRKIGPARYLSILGKGDPSQTQFSEKIRGLYSVAYAIKFQQKALGHDFVVPKLEGLWWYDEQRFAALSMADSVARVPRSEWEYRLMLMLPDFVDEKEVPKVAAETAIKKNMEAAREVEFFELHENEVVQMLHVGPFSAEPETIAQLQTFILKNGLGRNGLHHEIYLSDFRKTAPEKLRTILREPVTVTKC